MIDEVESLDFRLIKDAAEMQRRGYGEVTAEPIGRQARIPFREYVVAPVWMFSLITFLGIGGFLGLLVVLYMRLTATDFKPEFLIIAIGPALAAACLIGFVTGWIFLQDWRQLQWKYKKQTLGVGKRQSDQTRPIVEVVPGMRRVSRVTWQNGGIKELARRCHNEKGEWTAGRELNRKLFENPPLYKNVSENYGLLCQTLFEWGWINDPDPKNRPRWLNKGKMDLRGDLFIS